MTDILKRIQREMELLRKGEIILEEPKNKIMLTQKQIEESEREQMLPQKDVGIERLRKKCSVRKFSPQNKILHPNKSLKLK